MRRPRGKRLPAIVGPRPRILFVGINPSLRSAEVGHHFAGPGNPFWRLLHAAGLISRVDSPVKLLATGEADRAYAVRGVAASASARAKIEAAGGSVEA